MEDFVRFEIRHKNSPSHFYETGCSVRTLRRGRRFASVIYFFRRRALGEALSRRDVLRFLAFVRFRSGARARSRLRWRTSTR